MDGQDLLDAVQFEQQHVFNHEINSVETVQAQILIDHRE
jgi:hypothetical protein